MRSDIPVKPVLVRELIGESLREERVAQGRTLREVSKSARVSLGYLSEVERGQKEASSELLAAICSALDLPLSVVLNVVSEKMAMHEQLVAHERVAALPTVRRRWPRPPPDLSSCSCRAAEPIRQPGAGRSRRPCGVIRKPAACSASLTAAEPKTCPPSARSTVSSAELAALDGSGQRVGGRGQSRLDPR